MEESTQCAGSGTSASTSSSSAVLSPPHFQQLYDLIDSDLWTDYVNLCSQETTSMIIQQRNLICATILRTFPIMQNLSLPFLVQEWLDAQLDSFGEKPISKPVVPLVRLPSEQQIPLVDSSSSSFGPGSKAMATAAGKDDVNMRQSMLESRLNPSASPFQPVISNNGDNMTVTTTASSGVAANPTINLVPKPKKAVLQTTVLSPKPSSSFTSSQPIESKSLETKILEVKPKPQLQTINSIQTSESGSSTVKTVPFNSISASSSSTTALDDKPKEPVQMLSTRKKTTVTTIQKQPSSDEALPITGLKRQDSQNIFLQTAHKEKHVQIVNIIHLYCLNLFSMAEHSAVTLPFKASRKIALISFSRILMKLQKLSKFTTLHCVKSRSSNTFVLNTVDVLINFARALVEQLLPVVKSLGKAVIKSLLSNTWLNNDSYWPVISVLQDHLDNIGGASEHNKSTDRLYSNMAESYVKPFTEEDNRNEQKTKDDKDLYKKRGETSDKFHNLFQTFKNLSQREAGGSEINDFFKADFQSILG